MYKKSKSFEKPSPLTLRPGKITNFKGQVRDTKRVSLFIEGEFAFGLYTDLIAQFALEKGQFLTVERQRELMDADNLIKAKFSALEYLASRARTEKEVRDRLQGKGFEAHIAEAVVERFLELGYLNDENFAKQYASGRVRNKGHGPRRIQQELRRKGVASEYIQQAIECTAEEVSPYDVALPIAEKRWARLAKEPNPMKRRKKLQDFLIRRGYTFDTIRQIVETLRNQD